MTLENGLYRTHSIYSLLGSPGFLGVLEGSLGLRLHHILMIAHVSVSGLLGTKVSNQCAANARYAQVRSYIH
jgi:hypothetical protein